MHAANHDYKVGDKVKVIGYRPATYPPGYIDEMGTEALFKYIVGRRYTIRGFDDYGNIELSPTRKDTIWIERDLVRPVRPKRVA